MAVSITTKRGDSGETDLLFGGRAAKSHPRLQAVGEVDELNAALGLVRVHISQPDLIAAVPRFQEQLVGLMGLLSAGPENHQRYEAQGFQSLTAENLSELDRSCNCLEELFPDGFRDWSMPGSRGGAGSAFLELARCVCRRAERAVIALPVPDQPLNAHLLPWLNRFSDWLWLAARAEEKFQGIGSAPAPGKAPLQHLADELPAVP